MVGRPGVVFVNSAKTFCFINCGNSVGRESRTTRSNSCILTKVTWGKTQNKNKMHKNYELTFKELLCNWNSYNKYNFVQTNIL